jgi:glucose dehydrogenase
MRNSAMLEGGNTVQIKNSLYLALILLIASLATVRQSVAQVPCSGVIIPSRTLSINWPQLGFDAARTGCNPYESTLNQSNVRNLTVNWQYTTGQNVGAPVFADGIVFTSDITGTLYAISASTGALLWLNQPEADGTWGASAAVANGVVYLGFNDHHSGAANGLYAFNERTGALLWKYQTGVEEDSPVVANGVVYVLQDGLIALNASTGEPL